MKTTEGQGFWGKCGLAPESETADLHFPAEEAFEKAGSSERKTQLWIRTFGFETHFVV